MANRFNIRVYGLLIEDGAVLITDEIRSGNKMTKFPGGGLEFNEGIHDALKREFQEELNIDIEIEELFYINEFFQVSGFNPDDQLISIYYTIRRSSNNLLPISREPFEFLSEEPQAFRWIDLKEIQETMFTYPIDKKVAKKLKL